MKKIMVFLGSPRGGGNTEQLADAFITGAVRRGNDCEKFRLAAMSILPCDACAGCWSSGAPCLHDDDFNRLIAPKLERADALVFASPVYYYSWSTQMKLLFDRFYPYSQKPEFLNGKETALLCAAADETEKAFAGITAAYRGCCDYLSWKDRGSVLAFQTSEIGDVRQGNWLQKAESLGERF